MRSFAPAVDRPGSRTLPGRSQPHRPITATQSRRQLQPVQNRATDAGRAPAPEVRPFWARDGVVSPARAVHGHHDRRAYHSPTVSSAGDVLERDADAVADKVLARAAPVAVTPGPVAIPTSGVARPDARGASTGPTIRAAGSAGVPLSSQVRSCFEPRFGHDLGRVRIHADSKGVDADAYVRNDAQFKEAARKDGGRAKAITEYAKTDDNEFFAECFALFIQQPATLKALRPNIYAYFDTYQYGAPKDPKLNP